MKNKKIIKNLSKYIWKINEKIIKEGMKKNKLLY